MLNVGEMSGLVCFGITTPVAVVRVFLIPASALPLKNAFFPSFKVLPLFALSWSCGSSLPSPAPSPSSGSAAPAAFAAATSSSRPLISSKISPMVLASSMASVNSWPESACAFFPSSASLFLRSFLDIFSNSSLVMSLISFHIFLLAHVCHSKFNNFV